MFRVGLTGGVGSGKSTIAGMLGDLGAGIVDADAIAHQLTQPGGAAIETLRRTFGANAFAADGSLDRHWMRARAFTDADTRRKLEAALHPPIREAMARRAEDLTAAGAPYVVFVIPLLVESGQAHTRMDRVLVVDCSVDVQTRRVCQRPGIDAALAARIIAAQARRSERLAAADDVIFNEAPLPLIEAAVARLHRAYLNHVCAPNSADIQVR